MGVRGKAVCVATASPVRCGLLEVPNPTQGVACMRWLQRAHTHRPCITRGPRYVLHTARARVLMLMMQPWGLWGAVVN